MLNFINFVRYKLIFAGDVEIAELLIKKGGANVNAENEDKETPLHFAASPRLDSEIN